MKKRVVITGMGAVTPLGNNVKDTWANLSKGKSGIARITIFDAESFPTKIAGEVKDFDFGKWPAKETGLKFLGRNSHFALEAAEEAVRHAGLKNTRLDGRD